MAEIGDIKPLQPTWPIKPRDQAGERRQPSPQPKQPPPQKRDDDEDDQHIDDYA